jgi:hypothetical protein
MNVVHLLFQVFQVYLFMVAITFYIFIHIDIRRYVKTEHVTESLSSQLREEMRFGQELPFMLPNQSAICLPLNMRTGKQPIPENVEQKQRPYGFNTGRHADSLYLKLGAVGTVKSATFRLHFLKKSSFRSFLFRKYDSRWTSVQQTTGYCGDSAVFVVHQRN